MNGRWTISNWRRTISIVFLISLSAPVQAKTIHLASPLDTPPYVFQTTKTGIELDIIERVLSDMGHTVQWRFCPPARFVEMLEEKGISGAIRLKQNVKMPGVHFTDPYIKFQNVAISLAANKYKIASISDLKIHSLVTFQRALKYLGPEFFSMIKSRGKIPYLEVSEQKRQVKLIKSGRFDVAILEREIFKFYNRKTGKPASIIIHELFGSAKYSAGFKDKEFVKVFNKTFLLLQQSGEIKKIHDKYMN